MLFASLLVSPAAAQQTGSAAGSNLEVSLGMVAGAPQIHLGPSFYGLLRSWGGLGLYADARFDRESPARDQIYIDSLTVREVESRPNGDDVLQDTDAWRSFNLAVVRRMSADVRIYAGAGYARRERYRDYFDPAGRRGPGGFYRVRHEEESGAVVNLLGGGFFRVGKRVSFQVGAESAPRGATLGVSFRLF